VYVRELPSTTFVGLPLLTRRITEVMFTANRSRFTIQIVVLAVLGEGCRGVLGVMLRTPF
jgi:hypothetical protein